MLRSQSHPDFSPVGWHLGHIAYTESLWVAGHLAKCSRPLQQQKQQDEEQHSEQSYERPHEQQYKQLFSPDGLPKAQRQNLPEKAAILAYMDQVRSHTLSHLEKTPQPSVEANRLWHWLIQHEAQHAETMAIVLALYQLRLGLEGPMPVTQPALVTGNSSPSKADMVLIEAGEFLQGCDTPNAIDNERPIYLSSTDRYWLDRTPVTCGQYRSFIEAGGYQTSKWWCEAGWQWVRSAEIRAPLYWVEGKFDEHPVCGASWYEADAYARFIGKRLPTEGEWEKAAILSQQGTAYAPNRCEHMLGNVWEWTNSWFAGYSGFCPFPYAGYSQTYFDQAHRVLRGGSWASLPSIVRPSFRNWYHPHRREMFAGFRCAV